MMMRLIKFCFIGFFLSHNLFKGDLSSTCVIYILLQRLILALNMAEVSNNEVSVCEPNPWETNTQKALFQAVALLLALCMR